MRGKTKKLTALLMALLLCLSMGIPAAAVNDSQADAGSPGGMIVPYWVNTNDFYVDLAFSGSRADCSATVIGETGTTQITAVGVLARRNADGTYTTVKLWTGLSAPGDTLTFDKSYYVATGYTYRFTLTATVYKDGYGELVSGYCVTAA